MPASTCSCSAFSTALQALRPAAGAGRTRLQAEPAPGRERRLQAGMPPYRRPQVRTGGHGGRQKGAAADRTRTAAAARLWRCRREPGGSRRPAGWLIRTAAGSPTRRQSGGGRHPVGGGNGRRWRPRA